MKRVKNPHNKVRDIEDEIMITMPEADMAEALERIGDDPVILRLLEFRRAKIRKAIIYHSHYTRLSPAMTPTIMGLQGRLEFVEKLIDEAKAANKLKQTQ